MPKSLLPYMSVVFIIASWLGACIFVSSLGGWRALGEVYRAAQPPSGERFRPQIASMRIGTNYGSTLTMVANPHGLYLSVFVLMRIAHPSLFIPWEDVSSKPGRMFWFSTVTLEFRKCPGVSLTISRRIAARLSRASGHQFSIEGIKQEGGAGK